MSRSSGTTASLAAFAALALLAPACIDDVQFADPPQARTGTDDDFDITFAASPAHVHAGEMITFTFRVRRAGAPVEGLAPTAGLLHLETGTAVELKLSPGASGEYSGSRPFFAAGSWELDFAFKDGGADVSRVFQVEVASH